MPTKAPTLTEVARLAGCSKAAASTVLNNARGNISVSDELRKRVHNVAKRLNYRPNFASRSLALQRTQALGVYIPPGPWGGLGGVYEGAILHGVEWACQAEGYHLMVVNVAGKAEPHRCLHSLVERRIDGLLILHVAGDEPWIGELVERSEAVVAVDCHRPLASLDAIMFDHDRAIAMAVEHLVSLGHRRIGYMGACAVEPIAHNELRRAAFKRAVREQGVSEDPALVFGAEQSREVVHRGGDHCGRAGELGAEYFLGLGKRRPTAVVMYGDLVAAAAVRGWLGRGMKLPEAMSIVTIEDTLLPNYLVPRLTSVHHPLTQMGKRAARRLIERARPHAGGDGEVTDARPVLHEYCQPELIVRESTAGPSCA